MYTYYHNCVGLYNLVRRVGQSLPFGSLARESCKTCSHGDEIKASAMFVSAPQADKLMGRKGHWPAFIMPNDFNAVHDIV